MIKKKFYLNKPTFINWWFSLILITSILFSFIIINNNFFKSTEVVAVSGNWNATTQTAPSGAGTSESPYIIKTIPNLVYISNNYSKSYYKLAANLDLGSRYWQPIGNNSSTFTGYFDGDNFEIKNLYVQSGVYSYAGLFGYVSNGTISNVKIVGGEVRGNNYVGSVVAYMTGSSARLFNCSNTASVIAGSSSSNLYVYAGGIVGRAFINIDACKNFGNVTAIAASGYSNYTGGIAGYTSGTKTISNSMNHAPINSGTTSISSSYAAGISGYCSSVTIFSCINTGTINSVSSSTSYGGGIAGYTSSTTIESCISKDGEIKVGNESSTLYVYGGGISGRNGTIKNCISLSSVSGKARPSATNSVEIIEDAVYGAIDDNGNVTAPGWTWPGTKIYDVKTIYDTEKKYNIYMDVFGVDATISNSYYMSSTYGYENGKNYYSGYNYGRYGWSIAFGGVKWETDYSKTYKTKTTGTAYSNNSKTSCRYNAPSSIPGDWSSSYWGIGISGIEGGKIFLKSFYWMFA